MRLLHPRLHHDRGRRCSTAMAGRTQSRFARRWPRTCAAAAPTSASSARVAARRRRWSDDRRSHRPGRGSARSTSPPPATGYARRAYGNVTPDFGPSPWLQIDELARVTVFAGKVEYGQGIRCGPRHRGRRGAAGSSPPTSTWSSAIRTACRGTWGPSAASRRASPVSRCARPPRRPARRCLNWPADRLDLPAEQLQLASGAVQSVADPGRSVELRGPRCRRRHRGYSRRCRGAGPPPTSR